MNGVFRDVEFYPPLMVRASGMRFCHYLVLTFFVSHIISVSGRAHTDGGAELARHIVMMWDYEQERREELDKIALRSEFSLENGHPPRTVGHRCLDVLTSFVRYASLQRPSYVPLEYFNRGFELSYRNQAIRNLVGIYDPALISFRYQPFPIRVPDGARVNFSLWHGYGAKGSHAGPFLESIPILVDEKNKTQGKVRELLSKEGLSWIPSAAEAVDLPESGNGYITWPHLWGVPGNPFHTRSSTFERLNHYLAAHKSSGKEVLEVVAARSASAGLAAEINRLYPSSIDAMILIGPLHPDRNIGFKFSVDSYEKLVSEGKLVPNRVAFDWVNYMYAKMKWHQQSRPFGSTPVLIMVGEYDNELSPEAKAWFKDLAETQPNVRFVEIPGAGHDVLLSRREFKKEKDGVDLASYSPVNAYLEIQRFLNQMVRRGD
jgi:hypothetical protein